MHNLTTDELAQILWDFNRLEQPLVKSDVILVLGSNDIRVARYGADLFIRGLAPLIIMSGGTGALTQHIYSKPEAEIFADGAIIMGVPQDKILIENQSTNTGENLIYTRKLVEERGIKADTFIVVQKPYMLRRTFATFKKQWPSKDFVVTGPNIKFSDYPNEILPKELVINIMVGDTQRIKLYPEKGFQIPQDIPENVWDAYNELVERGFTKHLIKD